MGFTHLNERGEAHMVDVSGKTATAREAAACGSITMSRACFDLLREGGMPKGDVLAAARVAGIMAAKKTSELIPLCHIVPLTGVTVAFTLDEETCSVRAVCTAKAVHVTGVEMEALTGVTAALLTVYDMCKAVDKGMVLGDIHLVRKTGGKSGDYTFDAEEKR